MWVTDIIISDIYLKADLELRKIYESVENEEQKNNK